MKTIKRSDIGDEAYIFELETILEEMSDQTEVMYGAINLAIKALECIKSEYEHSDADVSREMYRLADLALSMLNGEPEADEGVH